MRHLFARVLLLLPGLMFARGDLQARPVSESAPFTTPDEGVDVVGDVDGTQAVPHKALQDTIWIADWSFDTGAPCDASGWQKVDNHMLNDGAIHWHVESRYQGTGGIVGNAGAVGYHGQSCCVSPNGYDNDWYQAIRISYTCDGLTPGQGGVQEGIAFDYLLDSEKNFDFLQVETDSACSSFERFAQCVDVDFFENCITAATFREIEFQNSGLQLDGHVPSTSPAWNGAVTDYGAGTHCLYLAFFSDGAQSPCDGNVSSSLGDGLVVDNIIVFDAAGTRSEDFGDGSLHIGTFVNLQESQPFGEWARVYPGITDNDFCTENRTCAWLWTDDTTPTIANDPSMAFGPGSFVIKNWLDDAIISPWVSLVSTPNASGTVLQFRRFGGNAFNSANIVQGYAVRGRHDVSGTLCAAPWVTAQWNTLSSFQWITSTLDVSSHVDVSDTSVQVRFRTTDWQWITSGAPIPPFLPTSGSTTTPFTRKPPKVSERTRQPAASFGLSASGF